ncbi:MAG: hypothetical protein K2I36_02920 [Ureaplasma sp.]|nr:hypothetical protein [Ureaplasma sp.]
MITKKENLIIFFDCYDSYFNDIKKYDCFLDNYEIKYCSFENLKKNKKTTIETIIKKVDESINCIKKEFIAIIHGQIGIWIYHHIQQFNPKMIFIIGTPFPQSLINLYLSDHPCYKSDEQSFLRQLKKMSYRFRENTNIISEKQLSIIYQEYFQNYEFYESINTQLNDYIYLRHYCKNKIKNNHHFIFGQNDQLMNIKKQIKLLKKQNANYLSIENCAYFVMFDQANICLEYIKKHLKKIN